MNSAKSQLCLLSSIVILSIAIDKPAISKESDRLTQSIAGQAQLLSEKETSRLEENKSTARDLITQSTIASVTGIEIEQTDDGLQIIFQTAGGERLVPLIVREGNDLLIDILDATLAFPIKDGVTELNPAPGINRVTVNEADDNSIQVRITGKDRTPSAEIVPGRDNLVLSIAPIGAATEQQADESIEVIATGEAEDEGDYYIPNASTATGTDTPIIETPFSAQVVPQEVIKQQQIVRIEEALNNVSGVSFAGSSSGREAAFNIRGFGTPASSGAPILRDGYRLYGSFQAIPEIANLEQVEVLKGPSSILYGQIEPGGIINLVSKQPLDEDLTEVELQIGNREFVRSRFDINIPASDGNRVSTRVNGVFQHEENFRNFDTDTNQFSLAPIFKWSIGDKPDGMASQRTDLTFNLEYTHEETAADFGIGRFGDGVAPVSREFVTNNPEDSIDTDYVSTGYSLEHRFNDSWKIRNGFRFIDYAFNFSVVALPTVFDGENVSRTFADQDGEDRSYSLYTNTVGKFNTGSIQHTLTAGIDLNRSESSIASLFGTPSIINIFDPNYDLVPTPDRSTLVPFGDTLNTSDRLGIYLQDQIKVFDSVTFVAGVRYDTISQTTTNVETAFTPGGETEKTDDAFTPRVGLLYRPINSLSLFANYSQSFEPNDDFTSGGTALDPEEGEGFEVGIKTETANKKLLDNLNLF